MIHLKFVLIMLTIGIFSTEERLLLASVQHRIGPITPIFAGLTISLADGVKLYAKLSSDSGTKQVNTSVLLVGYTITVVYFYTLTTVYSDACYDVTSVLIMILLYEGITLSAVLPLATLNYSKYTLLSILRIVYVGMLSEVLFIFILIVSMNMSNTSAIDYYCAHSTWLCTIISLQSMSFGISLVVVNMTSGRMPFDYAESESELVSGSSTDLSSVNFALTFLTELAEFIILVIIINLLICLTCIISTAVVVSSILVCYLPRILHCRAYVSDMMRYSAGTLIWGITLMLVLSL